MENVYLYFCQCVCLSVCQAYVQILRPDGRTDRVDSWMEQITLNKCISSNNISNTYPFVCMGGRTGGTSKVKLVYTLGKSLKK